jgi:hypothetical protein
MSKSSTSTLHRDALRCTRPRTPRQPASNGSNLGGITPLSRAEFPFAGSTSRPRAFNVTTALPPWRTSVSKRDTIAAQRSTRQGTRLDLAHYRASTSPGVVKAGLSEATCRYTRRCRSRV